VMKTPRRRKAPKLGVRDRPQVRCPQHLQWVRGHECAVANTNCEGRIQAAHVRKGTDGCLQVKPSDYWAIPLCAFHHKLQHDRGESSFQQGHGIDMKSIAEHLAKRSPHRHRWEDE